MSFDYGGVDFGATLLKDRASRELAQEGVISTATMTALQANRVMPPTASKAKIAKDMLVIAVLHGSA